eukprot:TRINITY_DN12281_c0_g1_i4.p1 TRINITY_DN12281_c0_g1~~TRINITY_DN12281_c0_g1_i4.p1  ORF type:complete len:265 (-),score=-16.18 TRINITY_DN12281_c0_g1_i4:815-1609(-)
MYMFFICIWIGISIDGYVLDITNVLLNNASRLYIHTYISSVQTSHSPNRTSTYNCIVVRKVIKFKTTFSLHQVCCSQLQSCTTAMNFYHFRTEHQTKCCNFLQQFQYVFLAALDIHLCTCFQIQLQSCTGIVVDQVLDYERKLQRYIAKVKLQRLVAIVKLQRQAISISYNLQLQINSYTTTINNFTTAIKDGYNLLQKHPYFLRYEYLRYLIILIYEKYEKDNLHMLYDLCIVYWCICMYFKRNVRLSKQQYLFYSSQQQQYQ